MTIEQRLVDDVIVIAISGDITMGGEPASGVADAVRTAVQQGHTQVVLDLGHVRYVDSTGLGELVHALSAAHTRGGALKLVHVTRRLADLLAVAHLSSVFDCHEQVEDAVRSFRRRTVPAA